MSQKLLDSFLDLKCPIHGCKLQHLEGSLFCPTEIILKLHPDEIFCGIWDIERVKINLTPFISSISSSYHKNLFKLKEYFNEQK